jgi:hypothetical protein
LPAWLTPNIKASTDPRFEQGQRTDLLVAYAERLKAIQIEKPFEVGVY